uniref:Protein phosphatase inhibitor 2 n=1 Tax=Arcella intermedia TaxID=1963864 RepID=A0A6B2LNZ0_9EUKA
MKTQPKGKKKSIVWDESNLIETSKERGTRQKIDEPDTPYHYPGDYSVSESGEEVSHEEHDAFWDQINSKLLVEKQKHEEGQMVLGFQQQQQDQEKRKAFHQKRKQHYNEGQHLKNSQNPPPPPKRAPHDPPPQDTHHQPKKRKK